MRSAATIRRFTENLAVILGAKCGCPPGTEAQVVCSAASMAIVSQRQILAWVLEDGPDPLSERLQQRADYVRSGGYERDLANKPSSPLDELLRGFVETMNRPRPVSTAPGSKAEPGNDTVSDPTHPAFGGRPAGDRGMFYMPSGSRFEGETLKAKGTVLGFGQTPDGSPAFAFQFVTPNGTSPAYALPAESVDVMIKGLQKLQEQAKART